MKRRIIAVLLIVAMLTCLCGCSLDGMENKILDIRNNGFSNLEEKVSALSQNWFSDLKSSLEDKKTYTFEDLEREVANFMSFDFDSVKVAYENDLRDALADTESSDVIILQKSIELKSDLVIPENKTLIISDGVILTVPAAISFDISAGANVIFDGISYLVLNENGLCYIDNDATLSFGESASLLMYVAGAITFGETASINIFGMLQVGTTFEVYSSQALDLAIRSAVDGGIIYLSAMDYGDETTGRVYNLDKAVSVIGTSKTDEETGEEIVSKVYGGFVITGDGASITSVAIQTPSVLATTYSSTLNNKYSVDAGVTITASDASVKYCTIYSSDKVKNAIEIFPYYSEEEETQSYLITGNTFVGFGDISDPLSAAIIVREYSTDVAWYGKTVASTVFDMSDTARIALSSNNTFEDSTLHTSIVNCISGEVVETVFVPSMNITEDYTFNRNYFIVENWNVSSAKLVVSSGSVVSVASGVHFDVAEDASIDIAEDASIYLYGGSVLETHGIISGSVTGGGSFLDWPNYIQFHMNIETSDGVWEEEMILGEYVGYTVSQLKSLYRVYKEMYGDEYILGYDIDFYLTDEKYGALADDYVFTEDTELYVGFTGYIMPIYYDLNGGYSNGSNRDDWAFPRTVYLENATTKKSDTYFAGWIIIGGTYSGTLINVMDDNLMIKLLDAGYTSLNLQATWTETKFINDLAKITYVYSTTSNLYDEHSEVYVYTPTGTTDTKSADMLVNVADGTGYNEDAYIYFEIEEGYELDTVIIVDTYNGTEYDVSNEAIMSYNNDEPLVYTYIRSFSIEVTTKELSDEIQEITYVGISKNNMITAITNISGHVFDYDDEIRFIARTANNEIVTNFYVVATLRDEDGEITVATYYTPSGITFGDDYEGGTVSFEIYAMDGCTVLAKDFEFDYTFNIN